MKILGLHLSEKYKSEESAQELRYGKIMIMADQDEDGSHIKGLIINLIHFLWPNLLNYNFIAEFKTPLIKVSAVKFICPLPAKPKGTLGLHSVRLSVHLSVCPSVRANE